MSHSAQQPAPPADSALLDGLQLEQIKAILDEAALQYDRARHGPLEPVFGYRTRHGARHMVCINHHPELDWRVIDLAPGGEAFLVARMEGIDDVRPQALACARDYATQAQLFHRGVREDPPIVRPKRMHVSAAPTSPDAAGADRSPTGFQAEAMKPARRLRRPHTARQAAQEAARPKRPAPSASGAAVF